MIQVVYHEPYVGGGDWHDLKRAGPGAAPSAALCSAHLGVHCVHCVHGFIQRPAVLSTLSSIVAGVDRGVT